MNKEYKIKLDLNKKLYNKKMAFNQFDENVNDFYIEVTKNNEVVKDLDKSIITLVAIKPNGEVDAQFIEVKEGQIYANLKPSMCDLVGNYQAKAMITLEREIVTTDTINYSVNEDKIISRLNEDVVSDERFTLFTDALARLSTIEITEEQRIVNEAERIVAEENRKKEESKRVEAELVRQHEEADRAKYDATRESNENIRKQNESIRLANETNRIDEEAKRVEEENKRKLAEEERNANYNFMTEDEERRRSEANAHKEAEVLRVQAENTRVNEEAKRRTTEQGRVSAENTRVSNENTRKSNEETRQSNETKRVQAETQRQNRYNSFISDAEANANNFENYTNSAKVKEDERKSNELDRQTQEDGRVSNEVERISNENTRKANENARIELEKQRVDAENLRKEKIIEIQSDYDSLKKVIIDENASANLQNQINQTNSQLEHIAINIFNYLDDVVVINGKEDWKYAFDNAFSDLQDGGTLLIPKHNYYISSRTVLENKKNIIINCAGIIMPLDNTKPIIGTLTFRNLSECTFNGLCFDGNASNVTPTNSFGTHSVLCIENSSNIVFNNLVIRNTYESGVTSNGNLNNVILNNVDLYNIGEHGFYFGGTNVKNVTVNNVNCTNIGTSSPNKNRSVAVIKFRNKVEGHILHDNISVNNFYFENKTDNNWHDGNTRDFIQAFDCKNVNIRNGIVKGTNTCIFQTNVCVDNFLVDNVKFDGKFFCYDIKTIYGYNESTPITNYGKCNIKFINCDLKGCSRNISLGKFDNCKIELTSICNDAVIADDLVFTNFKKCYFDNCDISTGLYRFDFTKATSLKFKDVCFDDMNPGSQPLLNLALPANSIVDICNVDMSSEINLFLTSTTNIYCNIVNSKIKGIIKSTVQFLELKITDTFVKEYRLNLYSSYKNLKVNGLYKLTGERVDFSVHKQRCLASNTEATLSLQYKRVDNVTLDNLVITNDKNIPYTVTIDNNILTLSTIETQPSDTIFTVVYIA